MASYYDSSQSSPPPPPVVHSSSRINLTTSPSHTSQRRASVGEIHKSMQANQSFRKKLLIGVLIGLAIGFLLGFVPTYTSLKDDSSSSTASTLSATAEPETDVLANATYSEAKLLSTIASDATGDSCTIYSDSDAVACSRGSLSGYTTNQKGLDLIKTMEGFYGNFYIDPVGIRTIGYGHACHALPCTGPDFASLPLTRAKAEEILKKDLVIYENCIKDATSVNLNINEFSALVSFVFNVGCGAYKTSTLLRLLNQGQYSEVPAQLNRWTRGGGKVLPGLVRRRGLEGDLWRDTSCSSSSSEVTGITGRCKEVSMCSGSTRAGLCPGPSSVQCCYNEEVVPDSCAVSADKTGTCVDVNSCDGTSTPGFCKGPVNIQCCVKENLKPPDPLQSCQVTDGRQGVCDTTARCSLSSNTESVAGFCPNLPADVQCCVSTVNNNPPELTCTAEGVTGLCKSTSQCSGANEKSVAGLCPGPSDIQCCITKPAPPPTINCVASGVTGECQDYTTCSGPTVRNKCPGASNIRCCLPSSASTTCSVGGQSGYCVDTGVCAGTSTPGFCPGASNIQCCTEKPTTLQCNEDFGAETSYDAYQRGSYLGRIKTVVLQGKPVEKNTACAFTKMYNAARQSGTTLRINSAFRTMAQQRYFWNCYVTKSCNNGNLAARPGYSNHQSGIALDLSTAAYAWLAANAHDFGFVRTVPSESWHWEYRPGSPKASYT